MMTGHFISDSREERVNGKLLPKHHAKYKIVACYLNTLSKYPLYDNNHHVVGEYVAWQKKYAKIRKSSTYAPTVFRMKIHRHYRMKVKNLCCLPVNVVKSVMIGLICPNVSSFIVNIGICNIQKGEHGF